ncbi:hypothetical protein PSN45_004159 [Yamadazyma tenuis]|uniref:uncharacterized protein n=1 Tax=Candida tenuis TaxID=2315449 RepID=UPI00279FD480|nr:hypothetical protein PSN45_004159 [Yamadazyma tenuis]
MKDDSKSSLKHFFKANSVGSHSGDGDDRSYRFFLKKRDTQDSTASSLENSSSIESTNTTGSEKKASHVSLKRFLKKFKHDDKDKDKRRTHFLPSHSTSELYRKYTTGKFLGAGASGSVSLVHLKTDPSKVYAVKKFRAKLTNESESDYKVKVNNEFKIGEVLDHENLIKTTEMIKDQSTVFGAIDYYIIMEYCKYDFFNLVMSGLMNLEEINCYFRQIVNGVGYLHSMGLAHRDLKLDNCVVNEDGILKLIDFGSSVQFRKPIPEDVTPAHIIESDEQKYQLVMSTGVVGSDPYLSPEVFSQAEPGEERGYDSRKVDVWSIGIIYCCMILRRFPWKIPKLSDPSYRSFVKDNEKIFKLLPEESVPLISKLLKPVDERCLITDVLEDEFVETISACTRASTSNTHKHNLVTEEELEQINKEKEMIKKLQNTGIA